MKSIAKLPKPKVSERMKIFVDHGIDQLPYWDFCCDHGYIGIHALKSERFSEVHFVDQIPHIIERLQALFAQSDKVKPEYKYFFHIAAGEDLITKVEGNCLIAGVGGTTIKVILETLSQKDLLHAKRLLLSPHLDEHILNPFMESLNDRYKLVEKIEIPEGKRVRPLYIYDRT
jgi:tRNA (adenine22-N1)-methyltransferase